MELPSYFADFLKEIRPTANQRQSYQTGHHTLRDRLLAYEDLAPLIVTTFLQGSYRRATAVRPKADKRADVDVIVVTRFHTDEYSPQEAMDTFTPFLDKYYAGKYRIQGRSLGIEMGYVDLDLVITAAPSEAVEGILKSLGENVEYLPEDEGDASSTDAQFSAEGDILIKALARAGLKEAEWKSEPLLIPDREADSWDPTDPLAQIEFTWAKNRACNTHYINVVKALKWWRRAFYGDAQPKGYPLEHFIGLCCPDGITSVAEGVTLTLEKIARDYKWYVDFKLKPPMPDHGVPDHDVFARLTVEEFATFHGQVCAAAEIARRAYDIEDDVAGSANAWRELFGDKFPKPPDKSGFTRREGPSIVTPGRFA